MKKKVLKNWVIGTGVLALNLFVPVVSETPVGQAVSMLTNQIEAQASQTYSGNWKEDESGNWRFYRSDGELVKDYWVHDFGERYLFDSDGIMRTGMFRSNDGKYYLLDTTKGTGTYGRLLKNGDVYQGITLKADKYDGALSDETLQQLAAAGVDTVNVPDIKDTRTMGTLYIGNSAEIEASKREPEKLVPANWDEEDTISDELWQAAMSNMNQHIDEYTWNQAVNSEKNNLKHKVKELAPSNPELAGITDDIIDNYTDEEVIQLGARIIQIERGY